MGRPRHRRAGKGDPRRWGREAPAHVSTDGGHSAEITTKAGDQPACFPLTAPGGTPMV